MSDEMHAAAERQIDRLETLVAASVAETKRLRAVNADLQRELKNMTLLFKSALLCTSVEIAREAKSHIAEAEAAIARAEGK